MRTLSDAENADCISLELRSYRTIVIRRDPALPSTAIVKGAWLGHDFNMPNAVLVEAIADALGVKPPPPPPSAPPSGQSASWVLTHFEELLTKAGYIEADDDADDLQVLIRALEDVLHDLATASRAVNARGAGGSDALPDAPSVGSELCDGANS